jgi:hypothetical protein
MLAALVHLHPSLTRLRCEALGLVLLTCIFVGVDARAGVKIRVRGAARIDVRPARDSGELVLSGTLADDAGGAITSNAITVTIAKEDSTSVPIPIFAADYHVRRCGANGRDPRPTGSGAMLLTTDEAGHFCLRATLPVDRYVAHVSWSGNALVDGANVDAPIDMARQALALRFVPEPRVIDIDSTELRIDASAAIDENAMAHPGAGLTIALTNEADAALGIATTNGSGRATFAIDPNRLGKPGPGELRIAFRGNRPRSNVARTSRFASYPAQTTRKSACPKMDFVSTSRSKANTEKSRAAASKRVSGMRSSARRKSKQDTRTSSQHSQRAA